MTAGAPWRVDRESAPSANRLIVSRGEAPLSRGGFLDGLEADAGLRAALIQAIVQAPFKGVFFECPPITRSNQERPFECVLVDAPVLTDVAPDPRAFARVFARAGPDEEAVAFANLGGDARLIAPTPRLLTGAAHLATFLREQPAERADALFQALGRVARAGVDDRPLWINTSGLGVAWLHVRLDRAPKYYTHAPYRDPAA